MGIITPDQYAAYATMNGLDTAPPSLTDAIAKASVEAVQLSGREFTPSPADPAATETRTYRGSSRFMLYIDDALSIASVTLGGVSVTDYSGVALEGLPIVALERTLERWTSCAEVAVTGRFGYSEQAALPEDVVEAVCILTALRLVAGPTLWDQAGSVDDAKVTVLNVTLDSSKPVNRDAIADLRKSAEKTLRGYRRMVV